MNATLSGPALRDVAETAMLAARLANDLPRFLRTPLPLAEARARVRRRLAERERRFLLLADHAIYRRPANPYQWLLRQAGCELGDLRSLVAREGLEGALRTLAARGVYVRFDEFKGRVPLIRGSARLACTDRHFDNPLTRPHLLSYTGGTGGRPSRVLRALGNVEEGASTVATVLDAHGIRRPRLVFWVGGSVIWPLLHLKLGHPVEAWFVPTRQPPPVRAAMRFVAILAARGGRRLPSPVLREPEDAGQVARWLASHARPGQPILVNTRASAAIRVATAARALGLTLPDVTFHCRSELFTDARRRLIAESGAGALPDYASMELPFLAHSCPAGLASDDLHLAADRYAAVERTRPLFEGGPTVDALLLTTLSPWAPRLALNAELGDSARVEQRGGDCCPLGALGLTTHLSAIRSFEKLSTEGTSFARSNVVQIVEEFLPARFGGSALDYQLVEEEGAAGETLLVLRVHPSLGPVDESAIAEAFLAELGRGSIVERYQAALLRQAASVRIARQPPLATAAGKVLPFQLARRAQPPGPGR